MKKLIASAIVVSAALAFGFAQNAAAASAAQPMTKQQSKFSACAHKSKGMKGEAHKKFMSDCLKGKSAKTPAPASAKQDKKKTGGGK